jgi:hypothetical protein
LTNNVIQALGITPADRRQRRERVQAAPGRRRPGNAPAAGERLLQERPGQLFGPLGQRVHATQARQPQQNVHCRTPSEDVLFSITSYHLVLLAGRPCWHQGPCWVRCYRRDPDGDHRLVLACRPDQDFDGACAPGVSDALLDRMSGSAACG